MVEEEKDFGIPDEEQGSDRIDASISHSEMMEPEGTMVLGHIVPQEVLMAVPKTRRPKKSQKKIKTNIDLTPLLNGLELEIEEIMGLLDLVMGVDRRTDILCRKVSNSLMRIQDIRDKIAAEMMGG